MKRQLNVNNFKYQISFGLKYGSYFSDEVLWGTIDGLLKSEDQVFPQYISTDQFYSYGYTGQVSGSASASGAVNVYVYRDNKYTVTTCPIEGSRWVSEATHRETYVVPDYDPTTGEKTGEHEEVVYYTHPMEVQEGIKMFNYCTGFSS